MKSLKTGFREYKPVIHVRAVERNDIRDFLFKTFSNSLDALFG